MNDTGIQDAEFLYDFSVNPVFERLDSLPDSFVHKLAHYFSHKYDVRIEPEKICANLVPQRPEEPTLYELCGRRLSECLELKKRMNRR